MGKDRGEEKKVEPSGEVKKRAFQHVLSSLAEAGDRWLICDAWF